MKSTRPEFREFLTRCIKGKDMFFFDIAIGNFTEQLESLLRLIDVDSQKFIEHRDEILTLRNWIVELTKEVHHVCQLEQHRLYFSRRTCAEILVDRPFWDNEPHVDVWPKEFHIKLQNPSSFKISW